ncbi:unnamed protein product [Bursaphelenchus xylophilus]|uniref:(pine wood nematode) hypothetical protein n=1 Tax=Bursaphelenchus xylophilus TaxID=6326 RepID=A0A1I7RUV3_BURXY|nr:unnamed protein product [Bursaphelenchus xylophilus]CAG9105399.1 unnamed protein product [Bursaphelenchus xylophilus]
MANLTSTCRLSNVGDLEPAVFRSVACVKCLLYIYMVQPPYKSLYGFNEKNVCEDGFLFCPEDSDDCSCENEKYLYNLPEFSMRSVRNLNSLNVTPPLPRDFEPIVRDCCQAADSCCNNVLSHDAYEEDHEVSCPATWDGWQCFGRSSPAIIQQDCPLYIYGSAWQQDIKSGVKKECESNGEWSTKRPGYLGFSSEYTDYTGCSFKEVWFEPILILTIVAYIISVIFIVFTIALISSSKYLKKQYVFKIHRHLLFSLLFSSLAYIVNALLFTPFSHYGIELYFSNHILCRILFIIQFAYFPLTSFCWMLAEGIHLYWLLFRSLAHGSPHIKFLPWACWGLPVLLTILYAVPAELFDSDQCLTEPSNNWWIRVWLVAPRFICLGVNVIILSVTLRLLLQKLKMNTNCSKLRNYLKVMRAMLMLVPLFGIHLFLVIIETGKASDVHDIIKMVVNGFQGFLVSSVICYSNRMKLFRSKRRGRFALFSSDVVSHDRLHSDSKCVLVALQKQNEIREALQRKSTGTTTASGH